MAYYVALDSGGTKTECWLGDETQVLARASCASVKLTRVDRAIAHERLLGLLVEVQMLSGVDLNQVKRVCAGLSGYSLTEVRRWAEHLLGAVMPHADVLLCGDEEIALDGAFQGGPGILVICGTGSNVVGQCADGTRYRAGGWGPAIGDEGSGYWIGAQALRAAFHAVDRGVTNGLLEGIRGAWGLADDGAVVEFANALPAPDFAALTPVVVRVAAAGDPVARRVLHDAGAALAEQVNVVWEKMRDREQDGCRVACTGSVLEWVEPVRTAMKQSLPAGLTLLAEPANALEGALWRARTAGSHQRLSGS